MIGTDHLTHSEAIAERLRKDVILVNWRYYVGVKDDARPKLTKAGFKQFVLAPAFGCYGYRFFPTAWALENTLEMAEQWDKTRFPDDPQKYRTKFSGHTD